METTVNKDLVDSIIREKMMVTLGAGLIPIPMVDILAVSAVQVAMVRQISRAFGIDYKESDGKALITALTGASLARIGGSLAKTIPGIGTFFGGVTTSILSAASTYAVGEVFKKHFETGGTFLDFDLASLKKYYDEKFEKGKGMATKMKKEKDKKASSPKEETTVEVNDEMAARLREYEQLREAKVITAEEFKHLKKKLFDSSSSD